MRENPGDSDSRPATTVGSGRRAALADHRGHQRVPRSHGGTDRLSCPVCFGRRRGCRIIGTAGFRHFGAPRDVLVDVRRITDVCSLPLLVDIDTGFGGAFNLARSVRSLIRAGAGGCHIEDQVLAKRCGHRPGQGHESRPKKWSIASRRPRTLALIQLL